MSELIPSRRSFLIGFGALIAAPAIVRASNIMPVKQMLILPPKLDDITFPIEGFARNVGIEQNEFVSVGAMDDWGKSPRRRFVPMREEIAKFDNEYGPQWTFSEKHAVYSSSLEHVHNNDRWERLKKRELHQHQEWNDRIKSSIDYAERIKKAGYQWPDQKL